ncbi:unnamed protein product [Paramecium pentaurelia]|uniref:Uncharacterized protein n=1 Tax=Paramecium pentaurelia TaxID=43138 RepID=A0A8S1T000_9CILI|nr:unnamed protein product [Paramecium pentaurelia]
MNNLVEQKSHLLDEKFEQYDDGTYEYDGILWDYNINPPRKIRTKFLVTFTESKQIYYTQDKICIRIYQYKNISDKHEVMNNLEQIYYLQLIGEYGKNNQKIGKWRATWDGEILKDVGGEYSEDGKKQGQWKEINKNFWREVNLQFYSLAQVYEVGQYVNDQRNGTWKFIYENNEIGGGKYNMDSQKNGKWIDLSSEFWSESQVTYSGEYKNGKKIGIWDVWFYDDNDKKKNQLIGCGLYQEKQGESIKIGRWYELSDEFCKESQIIYSGEYKNDKKVGRWDIFYRRKAKYQFKQIQFLVVEGHMMKNQKQQTQIRLDNGLNWAMGLRKILKQFLQVNIKMVKRQVSGIFNMKENICKIILLIQYDKKYSGGGQYDDKVEKVDSIKIGKWIELFDGFSNISQVIYNGEYINGKQVGRWDILYRKKNDIPFKMIGGGQYDENLYKVDSIKIGVWIELSETFYKYSQIIYNGEYKNGKKVGKWVKIDLMANEQIQEIDYDN